MIRQRIDRMRSPMARIDVGFRLDALMNRDMHEDIGGWPLPTLKQIDSMSSEDLKHLMQRRYGK